MGFASLVIFLAIGAVAARLVPWYWRCRAAPLFTTTWVGLPTLF